MRTAKRNFRLILLPALMCLFTGCWNSGQETNAKAMHVIVTSDTILSGMVASLLPPDHYAVEAILPPGQCPGHYDVKLSDIDKMKKADLVVSFKGMPYMDKAGPEGRERLFVDTHGHNWMVPDFYIEGLNFLAGYLIERYPEDRNRIISRKKEAIEQVRSKGVSLKEKIIRSGLAGKCIISSSMQKEPLEWMGFQVVGEYGRQEAMSAKEIVRLSRTGKDRRAILIVDNLQSGPDAGKGIAEALGVPHIVLNNFSSEKGYLATLAGNVDAVLSAGARR